jgi:hypothetical protein
VRLATELLERGLPVLFVTGYSRIPDLPPALQEVRIISKPVRAEILRAAVVDLVAPGEQV